MAGSHRLGGTDPFVVAPAHGASATINPATRSPVRGASQAASGAAESVSILSEEDMPVYPDDLHVAVERSIAELPPEKIWFTYRDLQRHFGVSRATIARRLKDGLVPGIRRLHGRVLEEGAVRRFDRAQLRWLLLALRCARP